MVTGCKIVKERERERDASVGNDARARCVNGAGKENVYFCVRFIREKKKTHGGRRERMDGGATSECDP